MNESYHFNIGNLNNPLYQPFSVEQSIDALNQQINKLNAMKAELARNTNPVEGNNDLWGDIDKEINSLTVEQKELLEQDTDYIEYNARLQELVQAALIDSVKYKVANTEEGKELLQKQLFNIKDKKKLIIEKATNDMKVFKQFQEAVRLNPNLTYSEFVKSLN